MPGTPQLSSIPGAIAAQIEPSRVDLREAVRQLRLTTLSWSVGWFCAAIGALMLIVPHQFSSPSFSVLRPYLPLMGGAAFLSGLGLVGVSALGWRGLSRLAVHLVCGSVLILFAYTLLLAGSLAGASIYSTLGLGTIAAALLPVGRQGARTHGDLLAVVLGLSALSTGLLMLLVPNLFVLSVFNGIRPYLLWFGLVYVGGGVALVAVQLRPPRSIWLLWLPHATIGLTFLAYLLLVSLPTRAITGMLFYGGFGSLLLMLPLVGLWLDRFDTASIYVRLALTLIATAALPLTVTISLITAQQEAVSVEQTFASRRLLASTLADGLEDFIALHQSAVAALAAEPGLLDAAPAAQRVLLERMNGFYPDFFACTTHDRVGQALARSDGRTPVAVADLAAFAQAQRTGKPALELRLSSTIQRPIIAFFAPVHALDGSFAGTVSCGLETTWIALTITDITAEGNRNVVVVDALGQVVASDGERLAPFTDLSDLPPVQAWRAQPEQGGVLRYGAPPQEWLAAYAPLNELGWGVLVERPLADDLSSVRGAREQAFGLLAGAVTLAALVALLVARYLNAPLNALAVAASRFGSGDAAAPLPRAGVSELARLSDAFDQMRQRLTLAAAGREQAIQQRDTFLSVAAHELKTPLTALLGQAQLFQRRAQREASLSARDQRSLDVVVAQAQRLNSLIAELLDVSRIEHGRLAIERAPLDLKLLVARVIEEFQPTVETHSIRCEGLSSAPLLIDGDALRLEQVLHNLLSNAVKYSPDGGEVTVRLSRAPGEALVAISDTGIGISAEAQPQLFERFFRAPNAETRSISGMGVGLFVVYEIVTLHGGRLLVTSTEGQGSTFTMLLPLATP